MKSRRKHGFQFMTILYFLIVFCMCVSRFNVIMTIMGGQLTRVEEINLLPFHSIRENLKYGRSPVSWDMLYNMVMFVPLESFTAIIKRISAYIKQLECHA